ncbi:MAG: heme ABC transporter permease [Alphaproteobacteria bacterium]|nr:heme ABC transporter permease [Alphaproteobacteria bacterium]
MFDWLFRYANPARFMGLSGALLPWLWSAALLTLATALYLGFSAPPDYQQGRTVLILFIHVPAAIMATNVYACMVVASLFSLINRHILADVAARTAAPLGAIFTLLALITGSLWGKPMWGTWWVWDGRLTSTLVQFFLYLGYIALWNAIEDETRAARICAVLALVGAVNIPIIKFSVDWWATLHQGESIMSGNLAGPFLVPFLVMMLFYMLLFVCLWLTRIRTLILERRLRSLMGAA